MTTESLNLTVVVVWVKPVIDLFQNKFVDTAAVLSYKYNYNANLEKCQYKVYSNY
jgi:hypothetical protein